MSRYGSGFREPPWVIGSPKEVMDWMEASHPSKKEKDKGKFEKDYLTNLHIKFDFDVKSKEIKPIGLFSKITNKKIIEEDFELLSTAELILRGLAKAKFKNTAKISVDGITLYDHPEKKSDLRKTLDNIDEYSSEILKGKNLEVVAILDDIEKCTATIKINKIHKKNDHSVDIQIKGRIKKDIYHSFLNYLDEKIGLIKDQR